jgi:hypothetical protein
VIPSARFGEELANSSKKPGNPEELRGQDVGSAEFLDSLNFGFEPTKLTSAVQTITEKEENSGKEYF